jgi:hypothetical protein
MGLRIRIPGLSIVLTSGGTRFRKCQIPASILMISNRRRIYWSFCLSIICLGYVTKRLATHRTHTCLITCHPSLSVICLGCTPKGLISYEMHTRLIIRIRVPDSRGLDQREEVVRP